MSNEIKSEIYRGFDLMYFPQTGRIEVSKDSIVLVYANSFEEAYKAVDAEKKKNAANK